MTGATSFTSVPIIDISGLRAPDSSERERVAAELGRAAREVGFFYVSGAGLDQELFDRMLAATKEFFALPLEEKMRSYIGLSRCHRGYVPVGAPDWFQDAPATGGASWGVANIPLTYNPPVTDPAQLTFVREEKADGPDVRCWVQAAPARELPNLKGMPHLLVVGEASSAASTNRCVSKYLTQAGVKNTWVNLGSVGIHGNGHMMMLEKNELEIAAFFAGWLRDNVEQGVKTRN